MRVMRMGSRSGSEQQEVALREIRESVEDGGFGGVEAGGAEGVQDEGAEEGAVEVVGLRHGALLRAMDIVLSWNHCYVSLAIV